MANEFKIIDGGRTTNGNAPITGTRSREKPALGAAAVTPGTDQVSLSRVYFAIRSSEAALRLRSLQLQVLQQTYRIPAIHISQRLVDEHLKAA